MKKKVNLQAAIDKIKNYKSLAVFPAILILLALPALAAPQSAADRADTEKALALAAKGQWSEAEKIIAMTGDELAAKIFMWASFTRGPQSNWMQTRFIALSQFIRQNPHWPEMRSLRLLAEDVMPVAQPAEDIIAWFTDYPPLTSRGMDRYIAALISKGRREEAKKILSAWWAKTPLSRESQREIYNKYHALLDKESHAKRLDALLFARQYANARAVAGVLGEDYKKLAEARIALAEENGNVNSLINAVPASLQNDPGLIYERLRWRRRHDLNAGALELLRLQPPRDKISNPEGWWQERHILIRRLIEQKKYKGAYILAADHQIEEEGLPFTQGEWLAGWLALRFLHEPQTALKHFETLHARVKTPVSVSRAAYWAGRAAAAAGDKELAKEWYRKAAALQTVYYGQLAGAELALEQELPQVAPPSLTAEDKNRFEAHDLIQAAKLFHRAGFRRESGAFIRAFVESEKSPKAYKYGAETASEMKLYNDAIRIAKDATSEGMFLTAQSYPVITERLKNIRTEWALVHAIIRQESMFDEQAVSPAGALGLMQLMPGTAKDVARKLGVSYHQSSLTQNPDMNIRLGSAYLQQMIERFGGNYVMAAAAYNAGPARVDKWIKQFGDPRLGEVDLIDWIEMIPIYETRNYVQRVMEGVYVYRLRLKGKQEKPVQPIHIAMP